MNDPVLFDIQRGSTVDGPGFRTVVFFKGCNLRCGWCHNPESQSFLPQLLVNEALCTHCGLCRQVCTHPSACICCGSCQIYCPQRARRLCGTPWKLVQVMEKILEDRNFYGKTGGGVTFSGGECMLQPESLQKLLQACRAEGIHTAVDTAGHVPWESFEKILPDTDLFLYDIKAMDSRVHKQHTGVDNTLILDNLEKLLAAEKTVILRLPLVAGVNDQPRQLLALLRWLQDRGRPEKIELLPCHSMGSGKYRSLGMDPPDFRPPSLERQKELEEILKQEGFA